MERLAEAAKTLLAARVDESGVAKKAGDRGTAQYLAGKSGGVAGHSSHRVGDEVT
ncbi:MAG: hypothetical protein ACRD07_10820 [Acidimicrobiales bacterium]